MFDSPPLPYPSGIVCLPIFLPGCATYVPLVRNHNTRVYLPIPSSNNYSTTNTPIPQKSRTASGSAKRQRTRSGSASPVKSATNSRCHQILMSASNAYTRECVPPQRHPPRGEWECFQARHASLAILSRRQCTGTRLDRGNRPLESHEQSRELYTPGFIRALYPRPPLGSCSSRMYPISPETTGQRS